MWGRHFSLRAWLWAAAALVLLPPSASDVIFRVPEVLVQHAAAPKSVGTGQSNASRGTESGRSNASRGNESDQWRADETLVEVRYEEYFVEHDVPTADAREAAKALNLDDVAVSRPGCGACSRRELEYCEARVLGDHCCCERRFLPEPLPWVPHTCYVGPARCRPLAHDCARYARLRDCCCLRLLAERWKGILSGSSPLAAAGSATLVLAPLVLVALLV